MPLNWRTIFSPGRRAIARADAARDRGDLALAAETYGDILERWGPRFAIMVQRGNALKDLGSFDAAEHAYRAALRLKPLDADVHLQLGHLAKARGDMPGAAARYREAVHLDPDLAAAGLELAHARRILEAARSEPRGRKLPDPDIDSRSRRMLRRLMIAHERIDGR
jgi:tetratricopeptide (TPR) repeat protein